jgi:hypothetical protein
LNPDGEADLAHAFCLIRLYPNDREAGLAKSHEYVHRLVGLYHPYHV